MDLDPFIKRVREETSKYEIEMQDRRQRAINLAREMARLLKVQFGVRKTELVGSMSKPEVAIGPQSDIDLLTYGLPTTDYFAALGAVEKLADGEFSVDLIRVEDVEERARKHFFQKGLTME